MRFLFCVFLLLCGFSAFGLSPLAEHLSYLKQGEKQKTFQKIQKDHLNKHLRGLQKTRQRQKSIQKKNRLLELEHEKQQKEFQEKRKRAFVKYKKQYVKYERKKKSILEKRLEKLSKIREQQKAFPKKKILFEL